MDYDDNSQGCGECSPCLFLEYDGDDPDTHCIDCKCIYCAPGN
jgi:hypothetical protein